MGQTSKRSTNFAEAWHWSRRYRIPASRPIASWILQMALGPALFATKVFSHPDLGRTYARAWELCRQLDDYSRERRRRSGRRVRRLRRQVHG